MTVPAALAPIRSLDDLLPGDVGFSTIGGRVGRGIAFGQLVLREPCIFSHAFLVLEDGWLLEAMPQGARIVRLTGDDLIPPRWGPQFAYGRIPLSATQRAQVDPLARHGLVLPDGRSVAKLEGRGYGFEDYLALAMWHYGLPGRKLVRNRVRRSDRLICSQAVDFAWTCLGYQNFTDGRLPMDVPPSSLFWQVLRTGLITVPAA